jgi:hypothetical protein
MNMDTASGQQGVQSDRVTCGGHAWTGQASWQAAGRPAPQPAATIAGESALFVNPAAIPAPADVEKSTYVVIDPSAASFHVQAFQDGLKAVPADSAVLDGIRFTSTLFATERLKVACAARK